MFEDYPKTRPALPEGIRRIYVAHYKENREGRSPAAFLAQRLERWLHRQVAADLRSDLSPRTTLEVGAGTLNQLRHEPAVGPYDIVEPFRELYADSRWRQRIRHIYGDIGEVPQDARYDRITSVATFEHICNLPEVIARSGLLLSGRGTLRVSIPSEGTPLWTLAWRLTTGLEFRIRHRLDYGLLLKHEHVNSAREIESLLRYFYREVTRKVLGLSRGVSVYQFYQCGRPDLERCRAYLKTIATPDHAP
jgi:hypothetical protein